VIPAVILFFTESDASMAGLSTSERVTASLFAAVTPRTAGFNTIDVAEMSQGGSLLTIILMFIGAAPGSTGGGVKMTTVLVLALGVSAYIRRRTEMHIGKRRIDDGLLRKACCNIGIYMIMTLTGAFIILISSGSISLHEGLFEAFSAASTVGMTMGATAKLAFMGKVAVICLMFGGRIGSIALVQTFAEKGTPANIKRPEEKILVG